MSKKFDFNDILIEPAEVCKFTSRSQVSPYHNEVNLPLMTAPMDTVVDTKNEHLFRALGITPVLPRGEMPTLADSFVSISLEDFDQYLNGTSTLVDGYNNILVDIANGHLQRLLDLAELFVKNYPQKNLMVGNVANPETFMKFSKLGVYGVRIGIGNGNGCLTTQQTGIGYPMASLIEECWQKNSIWSGHTAKIIADGGMKTYSDVIKALSLGADYVMCGSIFNKALESCGKTTMKGYDSYGIEYDDELDPLDPKTVKKFKAGEKMHKHFRGMSTKEVQLKWGKTPKTSEGVSRIREVEYTLSGWVDNFESYLRSAMSYTNSETLFEFKYSKKNLITAQSYNRFNK